MMEPFRFFHQEASKNIPDPIQDFLARPATYNHVLLSNFFHIIQSGTLRPMELENVNVHYRGAVEDFRTDIEHVRKIGKAATILTVEPAAIEIALPWTDLRGLHEEERRRIQQLLKVYRAESEIPLRNIAINLTAVGFRNVK